MAEIQGSYDELFTAVPSTLTGLLDDGDAGASVAVFVDGERVVDVWGGFADADRTIQWQRDTITNVWSVTKTMTALCALVGRPRAVGDGVRRSGARTATAVAGGL